ncbi:MAG: helix-turn-helix transcriptional regulator [Candidatus Heimdallarchaeota archaeon]|nr:helix-turn-helix transcriptional regulator [Candidatus Heimdallarchaeota archaeon]MDH5646182.1 helix-turn-helix transcriptional regulator [Candidatus Heimdallarchaeota archaeon]
MDFTGYDHPLPPEIVETIRLIGRKWALVILHELTHEPLGFGELKERIDGVSASVLSDLLNEFIEKEIIEKRIVSKNKSIYFITDFGGVLCSIITAISEWGSKLLSKQGNISVEEISEV